MISRPSLVDNVQRASQSANGSTGSLPMANQPTSNILSAIGDEKPVASGNGVSVSISLAEPVLFLQGFDQNDNSTRNTTMLRGSLHLKVTKSAKIKAITLKFSGKSETEWPEGWSLKVYVAQWS